METIYSLVTKPINQNVAIIRISGPETFLSTSKILDESLLDANQIKLFKIHDNDKFVDEVLVSKFVKPNSFTGEDVIEIYSHGNMFVVEQILNLIEAQGVRKSEPGEFMKQAYMNGKIDFSQATAINTLILSENKTLSLKASENINLKQSSFINGAIVSIGEIVSRIQISIDHPEDLELQEYSSEMFVKQLLDFKTKLEATIGDSIRLQKASKGIVMTLVGAPNVGKSSLLNALLQEDRAIVSDVEGTTRDVVESSIQLNDIKVTIQDTAGIRTTTDKIEALGIEKTKQAIEKSDIIILLFDSTVDYEQQLKNYAKEIDMSDSRIIKIFTKSDLSTVDGEISISTKEGNITSLLKSVEDFIKIKLNMSNFDNAFLITANQIASFKNILESVKTSISHFENKITDDIILMELESSLIELGTLIGKKIDKEYIETLFAGFCIGK